MWLDFSKEENPLFRCKQKPIISHIFDIIQRIEASIPYEDLRALSWEFSYSVNWHEARRAVTPNFPVWYVLITDRDGDCAHKNWTVYIDSNDGDLCICRNPYVFGNIIRHWGKPERRLTAAINAHLRLKHLSSQRKSR